MRCLYRRYRSEQREIVMTNGSDKAEPDSERLVSFERTRFEYCEKVFEREEQRRERLESKAQFYLAFITLFAGSLIFNADLITLIQQGISGKGSLVLRALVLLAAGSVVISLLF